MDNKKSIQSGSSLRKGGVIAALLLTALSLSACIVAEPGYRGDGHRHHHWNNDGDWNGGAGWQGNGGGWQGNGGDWNRHH